MANEPAAPSAGGSPHAHGSAASESIAKRADRIDQSLIQSLQKIQRIHGFRNKSETTWDVLDMLNPVDVGSCWMMSFRLATWLQVSMRAWKLMETAGPLRTSDLDIFRHL